MDIIQYVWIALVLVFVAVEAATVGITSIWFAVGALVSLLASFFNAPEWLQVVLFFLVAIVLIAVTRPLASKYINSRTQPTNADAVIGREATVTQRIDNNAGTGLATVGGRVWTARSASGHVIEVGTITRVAAISGVKIIVIPEREPVSLS